MIWRKLDLLCTLCRLVLQEPILITAHQSRAAQVESKRTWNKVKCFQGILENQFGTSCTLCMSSYPLFLLEHILLAAHQCKTAKREYRDLKQDYNDLKKTRDWCYCFGFVAYPMQDFLQILIGMHSNNCTSRQNS